MSTFNKVKEVIIDKLVVEEDMIKTEAHFVNDLGADSLDTVELIMEFEEEFGIEIPDEEAGTIVTVGDACAVIKKCKANKGKIKKINVDKYKNKQTPVPHPDSPLMSKKPLEGMNKTLPSDADLSDLD